MAIASSQISTPRNDCLMIVDFSSVNTIYNFLLASHWFTQEDLPLVGKMDNFAFTLRRYLANPQSQSIAVENQAIDDYQLWVISRVIARTTSSRKNQLID